MKDAVIVSIKKYVKKVAFYGTLLYNTSYNIIYG